MTSLLALFLAAAAVPEATPLSLGVEVVPEEVTLGEPIEVRISVEHDARDVYSLAKLDPAPLSAPEGAPDPRTRREDIGGGKARTVVELRLADYTTLEPRIPDLTLSVIGPDGPRQLSVRGRPLKFRSLVAEEGEPTPERAHHGPKPPVPVLVHSFLWAWLLAGIALAVAAWLLWRRYLRQKRERGVAVPEAFADDQALEKLAALRKAAPWAKGEGRSAIFEVSGILRAYLGARLHFNAPDLTSEEFLAELRRRRLIGLDLAGLIEQVAWEDLVKFAKLQPTADECLVAIDVAESIVHHTRPLRAIPARAA